MQIQLEKTLDVAVVERQLAQLWSDATHDPKAESQVEEADAVLRARVANLLVFVCVEEALERVHEMLQELTATHPSRVLVMLGARERPDRDIEMFVESICQIDKRGGNKRVSCEEITLKAAGKYVAELPSASLPLLVSDLATFLWWQNEPRVSDKVLDTLLRATDRLIIDSASFLEPKDDLLETTKLFGAEDYDHVGISDLNWARLTFWRELLADFYDVGVYRKPLDKIDLVEIDYVATEHGPNSVAPQALLFAGWLSSRLGWKLAEAQPSEKDSATLTLEFFRNGQEDSRRLKVRLNRVEQGECKPGRLVRVELRSSVDEAIAFTVVRSDDNLHLLAEAKLGANTHRGRVLPVRNRSTAQLLSREMEILCNDEIYQEALAVAAQIINRLK
ncbi:MAG TPA: glucose-6-phosphate dehydrogenase assembly protein OpcA [Pyrinomonadaceae bacterium]|jgi:glucose-6-phosphate dehydrogenase assembly protein OpcA